jgi:hypothetical protein
MPTQEVRLAVDSATFAKWRDAVANLRRSLTIPIVPVPPLPATLAVPRTLRVTGRRLLLELGNACSRPDVLDDPARLFGLLRYSQAVSIQTPGLTIAREIREYDTHKKAVLSDEFGCAVSFVVARSMFRASRVLDFETACRDQIVNTVARKRDRPDYLARCPAGYVVLEAKGTQGAGSYSAKQVRRGCRQVSGVRVTRPAPINIVARIAVGTALRFDDKRGTTVIRLGDPEEHRAVDYAFEDDVDAEVVRVHYLRVASLIGDARLVSVLDKRGRFRGAQHGSTERAIRGRSYLGGQVVARIGERELGIFVGLQADVRETLLSGRRDRIAATLERFSSEVSDTGAEVDVDAPLFDPKSWVDHELLASPDEAELTGDGLAIATWAT